MGSSGDNVPNSFLFEFWTPFGSLTGPQLKLRMGMRIAFCKTLSSNGSADECSGAASVLSRNLKAELVTNRQHSSAHSCRSGIRAQHRTRKSNFEI